MSEKEVIQEIIAYCKKRIAEADLKESGYYRKIIATLVVVS